jgi:hypothetical protein
MKLAQINSKVLSTTKCPFLKALSIDAGSNPAAKQLIKRFQVFCPYLYQRKMHELSKRMELLMKKQGDTSKCPFHQAKSEIVVEPTS